MDPLQKKVLRKNINDIRQHLNPSDNLLVFSYSEGLLTGKKRKQIEKSDDDREDKAEEFIEAVMESGGVDGFDLLLKGLRDSETRGNRELGERLQQAYQSLKAEEEARATTSQTPAASSSASASADGGAETSQTAAVSRAAGASAGQSDLDPWESTEFTDEYPWLVTSLSSLPFRLPFRGILGDIEFRRLSTIEKNDGEAAHNEKLFDHLKKRGRTAYENFLKMLGGQKGIEFKKRADRLNAAYYGGQ